MRLACFEVDEMCAINHLLQKICSIFFPFLSCVKQRNYFELGSRENLRILQRTDGTMLDWLNEIC